MPIEEEETFWASFDDAYMDVSDSYIYWIVEGNEILFDSEVGENIEEVYEELQTLVSWVVSQGLEVEGDFRVLGKDSLDVQLFIVDPKSDQIRRAWAKFHFTRPESLEDLTVDELIRLIRRGELVRKSEV